MVRGGGGWSKTWAMAMPASSIPRPKERNSNGWYKGWPGRGGGGVWIRFHEKLYVFLADRMAGTSPEYIMCFPPLGLGY